MAKQGMKRFYPERDKNDEKPVPEIQGKAKTGKRKARPLIAGIPGAEGKVYHTKPFSALDNDLAVENMENDWDMTAADLQDLGGNKS